MTNSRYFECPSCKVRAETFRFEHAEDCNLIGREIIYIVGYDSQESPSAPWHLFLVREPPAMGAANFCWFYERPHARNQAFSVADLLNEIEEFK